MRVLVLIALLLAGCGPLTRNDDVLPDDYAGAYGPVFAVGENWRFNAEPSASVFTIHMDDGTEVSGTWVSPSYVEGRISAGNIRVTLEIAGCQHDGVIYPMRATVTYPGRELTGCAAMRWDSQLDTLIEAIDACITAAPALRTVTYAGELPDGSTLVRVRDGDNAQDCRVERGRATHSPRDESLLLATDNAAILLRARPGETENPGGECYDAPEAWVYRGHPAMGEMVGWMMDPVGC